MFVFFGRECVAGGGPAAAYFSCLAQEKVSKRRRPQCIAPAGFLMLCRRNREGRTTRFAQTSVPLFPIATTHHQQCISGKDKTARFALRCLRSMVALRALVNC